MKVLILEVCRSPEVKKETEAVILSRFFTGQNIAYELYSNDGIWPTRTEIDKAFIRVCLSQPEAKIVHLAMHGDDYSFILRWSKDENIRARIPEEIMTGPDILKMKEWQGKVIVSGACNSSHLARFFLDAGAKAIVAPEVPISWLNLGDFFSVFYQALFAGEAVETALQLAVIRFPEYRSYRVHTL
jgi:hypothetical protein